MRRDPILRYLWYRVVKLRLIAEPHLLARDLFVALVVVASRSRRR